MALVISSFSFLFHISILSLFFLINFCICFFSSFFPLFFFFFFFFFHFCSSLFCPFLFFLLFSESYNASIARG